MTPSLSVLGFLVNSSNEGMVRPLKSVVAAFSPKGKNVALLTGDGSVKIWCSSGEYLDLSAALCDGEQKPAIAFSTLAWGAVLQQTDKPKKKTSLLVLGARTGAVVAWDAALGEVKWRTDECSSGAVTSLCFSKHEALFVSGEDGMVSEVDPLSGRLLQKFQGAKETVTAIAASPDGTMLAIAGCAIKLVDTSTKKRLRRFEGHESSVRSIAFTADGRYIISAATNEKDVKVWDSQGSSKEALLTLSMKRPPCALNSWGFAKEGSSLSILAISEAGEAYVWSGKNLEELGKASPSRIRAGDEHYSILARFAGPEELHLVCGTVYKPVFQTQAVSDHVQKAATDDKNNKKRKRSRDSVPSEGAQPEKAKKSVTFGEVTIFGDKNGGDENPDETNGKEEEPLDEQDSAVKTAARDLKRFDKDGKVIFQWFTAEEDDTIRKVATQAVKDVGWDVEEGFQILVKLQKGDSALRKKCFAEIAAALPHRTHRQVCRRATNVLDLWCKRGKWDEEETAKLYKLLEEHGPKWSLISSLMGRRWDEVKFKWRYQRNQNMRGRWTPEEIEKLCSLVHKDLAIKAKLGYSKSNRLSGISWHAISDHLGTRPDTHCMRLWYDSLCSPKFRTGEWPMGSDSRLLLKLLESGAPDEDSVDWGALLEDQSAENCRRRWKEMLNLLGKHKASPFETKLDLLVRRFAPSFLENDEDAQQEELEANNEAVKEVVKEDPKPVKKRKRSSATKA